MGVFEKLFKGKKPVKQFDGYFRMLDGYTPAYTNYDGGVYEMELTRSCIHAFANHCSKLHPVVEGADLRGLSKVLNGKPNDFMTSAQFLYKVATIYDAQNTCIIVPIVDKFDRTVGFYPVAPRQVEVVDKSGEPYVRITFGNGKKEAWELSRIGVVSKYLYKKDVLGEDNSAINTTLQLINMQNQGIREGIKNSASFRFMANVSNFSKDEDIRKERDRFVRENFGEGSGGLALFPNTYTNVQQINSTAKVVDTEQMRAIQERTYMWFGINEDVLCNKAVGDSWSAFYEGKIEPFAIQLAQALTAMSYSKDEIARGNTIMLSANRLQYMTMADKCQVASAMMDRGVISLNDAREIFQMPRVEDGDKRYIRKEYMEIEKTDEGGVLDDSDGQDEEQKPKPDKKPDVCAGDESSCG